MMRVVRQVIGIGSSCVVALSSVLSTPLMAQGITPGGPSAPGLVHTATGTPVVMIERPNDAGVSHNTYESFSVGSDGAILNNIDATYGQTRLGGYVQGNGNLSGRPAGVIVNEVVANNPSDLRGYLEVAGARADVVIANPYGLTCDGCGFINTDHATLTTGLPQYGATGSLESIDISRGHAVIGQGGVDARGVSQFDLLARTVKFAGAINGQSVRVVAGRNNVIYATGEVSVKGDGGGEAPEIAIDSTVLGGMYADRIIIRSTESGAGVRAPQNMAANAGEMHITADGRLVMGRAAAPKVTLRSTHSDVEIRESILAGEQAEIEAARDLVIAANGQLVSDSVLELGAGRDTVLRQGAVVASRGADVSVASGGTLRIADGASLYAPQDLNIAGGGLDLATGGTLLAADALNLRLSGGAAVLSAETRLAAGRVIALDGGNYVLGQDAAITAPSARIAVDGLALNGGAVLAPEALSLDVGNLTFANGTIATEDDLSLRAGSISGEGQLIATDGSLTINAGAVSLGDGQVIAGSDLSFSGDRLALGGVVTSRTGSLDLRARSGDLNIAGSAQMLAATDLNLNASGGVSLQDDAVALARDGDVSASFGRLSLGGDAQLAASQGVRMAGQAVSLGEDAVISAGDTLSLQAGEVTLGSGAAVQAGGPANVSASQDIRLGANATLSSGGNLVLNTGDLGLGDDAVIRAGGRASVLATGDTALGRGAVLASGGGLLLETDGLELAASAMVQAGADMVLNTGRLALNGGSLASGGDMAIRADSATGSDFGITSGGTLSMDAGRVDLGPGTIAGDGGLELQGDKLTLAGTNVISRNGSASLNSRQGDLVMTGLLAAGQDARVTSAGATTLGQVQAGGDALIDSAGDLTASGAIIADGVVDLASGGSIRGDGLSAGEDVIARAAGDILIGEGAAAEEAETDSDEDSRLAESDSVPEGAAQPGSGDVLAGRDIDMSAGGKIVIGGRAMAERDISLDAGGLLNIETMQVGRDLNMQSGIGDSRIGTLLLPNDFATQIAGNLRIGTVYGQKSVAITADTMQVGSFSAGGDGALHTLVGALDISGDFLSGGDAWLSAAGDLSAARLLAQGAVDVSAGGSVAFSDVIYAGTTADIVSGGSLLLTGLQSGGDARISSAGDTAIEADVISGGGLSADIGGALAIAGADSAEAGVSMLSAGTMTVNAAALSLGQNAQIAGMGPTTVLNIAGATSLEAAASILAASVLDLRSASLNMAAASGIQGGSVTLDIAQAVSMGQAAQIIAQDGLALTAQNLTMADSALIAQQGTGAAVIGVADAVRIDGGVIQSGGTLQIDTTRLAMSGSAAGNAAVVLSEGALNISASRISGDALSLIQSGTADVTLRGRGDALALNGGAVRAGGDIDVSAGTLSVQGSDLGAMGALRLASTVGRLDFDATAVAASIAMDSAASASIEGALAASGDILLSAAGNLSHGSTVGTPGLFAMQAGGTLTDRGQSEGVGALRMTGGSVDAGGSYVVAGNAELTSRGGLRQSGSIIAGGVIRAVAVGALINSGTLQASGLNLRGDRIDNSGTLYGAERVVMAATAGLANGGLIYSDGSLSLAAGGTILNRADGDILAYEGATTIRSAALDNRGDLALADAQFAVSGDFNNRGTYSGNSSGQIGGTLRNTGQIVGGNHELSVGGFDNRSRILTEGSFSLQMTGGQAANSGTIDVGALSIAGADDIVNAEGGVIKAGWLSLSAGNLTNDGRIQSSGLMAISIDDQLLNNGVIRMAAVVNEDDQALLSTIEAGTLENTGRIVTDGGALRITAHEALNNSGRIIALGDDSYLNIRADQVPDLSHISAPGTLELASSTGGLIDELVTEKGEELVAEGTLIIHVARVDNAGAIAGMDGLQLIGNRLDNSGLLYSGGDMALRFNNRIDNDGGLILAENSLAISARSADAEGNYNALGLLTNRGGGVIQTVTGDMYLNVTSLQNLRRTAADSPAGELRFTDAAPAQILSGGDLVLRGEELRNEYSLISANGDIALDLDRLSNIGAHSGDAANRSYAAATIQARGTVYGEVSGRLVNRSNGYATITEPAQAGAGGAVAHLARNDYTFLSGSGLRGRLDAVTHDEVRTNRAGAQIAGDAGLGLSVGGLNNSYGAIVSAKGQTAILASHNIANNYGLILGGANATTEEGERVASVVLSAGGDYNSVSGVVSGRDVVISARDITIRSGTRRVTTGDGYQDVVTKRAAINAKGTVNLQARRDLTLDGVRANARDSFIAVAGGEISLGTVNRESEFGDQDGSNYDYERRNSHLVTTITAGDDIALLSTGERAGEDGFANVTLAGSDLQAGGRIDIAALQGHVLLLSVADEYYTDKARKKSSWLGLKKKRTRTQHFERTQNTVSLAAGEIDIWAAGSIVAEGTSITAAGLKGQAAIDSGNVAMTAASGNIDFLAVENIIGDKREKTTKFVFGLFSSSKSTEDILANMEGAKVTTVGDLDLSAVAGSVLIQGGTFDIGGDFNLDTSQVYLQGIIDTHYRFEHSNVNNGFTITDKTRVTLDETAEMPRITVGGTNGLLDPDGPAIRFGGRGDGATSLDQFTRGQLMDALGPQGILAYAAGGSDGEGGDGDPAPHWTQTMADAYDGDAQLTTISLADMTGPGTDYLRHLENDQSGRVTYGTPTQLLEVDYYEKTVQTGVLTKVLIAIAAQQFGWGAWTTLAVNTAVDGVISGEVDFDNLIKQAAFTFAMNGLPGDLSGGFEGIYETDVLRSLSDAGIAGTELFSQKWMVEGLVSGSLQTVIYGGDLEDNILNSLQASSIRILMAEGQGWIGDVKSDEGSLDGMLLHGIVGCAAAEASGSNCAGGFVSAAATEYVTGVLHASNGADGYVLTAETMVRIVNPILAGLTSGGDVAQFETNLGINNSKVDNNYLDKEQRERAEELIRLVNSYECGAGPGPRPARCAEARAELQELQRASADNTLKMLEVCRAGPSQDCTAALNEAQDYIDWAGEMFSWQRAGYFDVSSGELGIEVDWGGSLDEFAVDIMRDNPGQAGYDAVVSKAIQHDGTMNLVVGVGTVAVVAVACVSTVGTGCAVVAAGAALGESNKIYDGAQTLISGEESPDAIHDGLSAVGMSEAQIDELTPWIEGGLLVVEIGSGGVAVFKATRAAVTAGKVDEVNDVIDRVGDATNTGPRLTIRDHYTHHNEMRTDVIDQLKGQGYKVADGEASFGSACGVGRCRPDILYEAPDGTKGIIEIKTGNADLSIRQTEIFPQIKDGNAIPRGNVAARFGLRPGVPLKDQGYPNGIAIEVREFPGAGQ
ncbi:MAG TPA: filamentous hemagglutinin N-terminal domain-containing protein [Paracoccus sp. (in: a-proteobacteria)]|uniref:two-partner secretion domain-containing protein n=1 Tax=uncultured Paracoccus sp. TaxID=189685 RepID=UPI00262A2494|nr:filamentous hemagglutinin N-terminal domain-containing protein [uncultured Paracoccus sp.]HMQ40146.1 filamentous hemagglutinin N-terminal domain-containing protein [Paracoccus sp. (in: a-proteobacteria)]HMR35118.1 filamentous hemagglutinin N-terminal domain-containing protein [Paracoccus sp. (in: a-proteobacteria)]